MTEMHRDPATDLLQEIFGHIEDTNAQGDEDHPDRCHFCGANLAEHEANDLAVFWDTQHLIWLCNNTDCLINHNSDTDREGCTAVLGELGYGHFDPLRD